MTFWGSDSHGILCPSPLSNTALGHSGTDQVHCSDVIHEGQSVCLDCQRLRLDEKLTALQVDNEAPGISQNSRSNLALPRGVTAKLR